MAPKNRSAKAASALFTAAALFASPLLALSTGPSNCVPTPVTYGVNSTFHADLARGAHIGWVRVNFRWRDVNPQNNVWDFSSTDGIVDAARNRGLEVLAILSTAPQWAGGGQYGNTPPANTAYWQQYVRRVAQRYSGRVAAYQVWNEPNLRDKTSPGVGWNRGISESPRYVDYLRIAAQEIRAAAPGTLVVAPGTASEPDPRNTEIFRQIEQTGSSQYVDVVNFNANGNGRTVSQIASWIDGHFSTIISDNPSNRWKPVWITEFGWESGAVGEAQQSTRIQQLVTSMRGDVGFCPPGGGCSQPICGGWSEWNITHAFIYTIIDAGSETSGIHRSNGTPKQVVSSHLATLPFPARDRSFEIPFTASCPSRSCTFTAAFTNLIFGYHWDFGDGTSADSAPGQSQVSHTFPRSGRFFVRVFGVAGGGVEVVQVP